MTSKPNFIRTRVLRATTDALIAGRDFDAQAMDSVWRTFQNIANEMARTPSDFVALDDSVAPELLSDGHSAPQSNEDQDDGGGGGHKVESDTPEPVLPSDGAKILADLLS